MEFHLELEATKCGCVELYGKSTRPCMKGHHSLLVAVLVCIMLVLRDCGGMCTHQLHTIVVVFSELEHNNILDPITCTTCMYVPST